MAAVHIDLRERSLLERIVYGILLVAVLVFGFFFLVAALIAGAALAGVMLLRYGWLRRKLQQAADAQIITTEYTVIAREQPKAPRLPPQQ